MGTSGRPSISKRQKEQARLDRQRDKAARRQQRKVDRQNGTVSPSDDVIEIAADGGSGVGESAVGESAA